MRFTRLVTSCVLLAAVCACQEQLPDYDPTFNVFPTPEGADIVVDVQGGPSSWAWVGFGAGPGAANSIADRVHSVQAHTSGGEPLEVIPYGHAGYGVDLGGERDWHLSYSLDLRPARGSDTFYRSSVRGDDYLVLVGSDAWARFFTGSEALAFRPDNRPSGMVVGSRVNFALADQQRDWSVGSTARQLSEHSFVLDEHPAASVFAVGSFEIGPAHEATGLRLAVHRDWHVMRDTVADISRDLLLALQNRMGPPGTERPLALLMPVPSELRIENGLRTAGMVRGASLILYASTSRAIHSSPRLQDAMAVFLGHEFFHLYVPSRIPVARELSWLSEGWAMHMGRHAAVDAQWLTAEGSERQLRDAYGRYLDLGGYRAGSLPAASMASDSTRDLLYLRGDLVFRLLSREWERSGNNEPFDLVLWRALVAVHQGNEPLSAEQVRGVLAEMLDPDLVRRYVEGTAALTQGALGLTR